MINCIIIEDQEPAQLILKKYIEDTGTLKLVGTFIDALSAISFLNNNTVQLIFLDINLPILSGVDFIKSQTKPYQIIFTTAFSEYAMEGYDLNIVDYLLKPFSFQRFIQAVSKVRNNTGKGKYKIEQNSLKKRIIFIKVGYHYISLDIANIFYIKGERDYTTVFVNNKSYLTSFTLTYWLEELLLPSHFIRVHKSYIVSLHRIHKTSKSQITLADNIIIPIGRNYRAVFFERIQKT